MEYFLCSKEVIKAFPEMEHSKPFRSGYDFELDEDYYIALLDLDKIEKYYNDNIKPNNDDTNNSYIDFWCRECVPGQMDVSKITLKGAKTKGLFVEIENKIGLTTGRNEAMTIYNLSEKYKCTPIEFINKIV